MRICVLTGSPKGESSVTYQYVEYMKRQAPDHEFDIRHVGQRINRLERERDAFDEVIETVRAADAVVWATPVYILLVTAQLKRFMELVWERDVADAFRGKYAMGFTTSINFCDHMAHQYLHAVAEDLGMRYYGGYSAAMYDLVKPKEQRRIASFTTHFLDAVEQKAPVARVYPPLDYETPAYTPGPGSGTLATQGKRVLVVTDSESPDSNLARMVDRFVACFKDPVEVINLNEVDIRNGCLGCIQCGYDAACVQMELDGYAEYFYHKLIPADILVYACTIKDRYFSAISKRATDREFFQGHKPSLIGKQFVYLISGPYRQDANLRQHVETAVEVQWSNLAGVITDQDGDSAHIDALIERAAADAVRYAQEDYMAPPQFLSVAGAKLFRDFVWGEYRFIFKQDHVFYRKHKLYDFPHKNIRHRLFNVLMTPLMAFPPFRKKFFQESRTGMLSPLKRVLR